LRRALIGYTGFVGGTIHRQAVFDALYNSSNIDELSGHHDLIVCAGAPGSKWQANQKPEHDWSSIERLINALDRTSTGEFILLSTVDVYPHPIEVDEDTHIDRDRNHAYGRHRRILEEFVQQRFGGLTVRLPGLFGRGLKKNVIFDLLHSNRLDLVSPDSVFQFYDLSNLWRDIERCRASGLGTINFATEPVSVRVLAQQAFAVDIENPTAPRPAQYDMHTRYPQVLGGRGHYHYDQAQVLRQLRQFVNEERQR
jgi:nucleoside-diphosphate-sugar epimerase